MIILINCHNPCFSGQCFAMNIATTIYIIMTGVTILVLVDSVLQSNNQTNKVKYKCCHNPCFSRQCFAMKGT